MAFNATKNMRLMGTLLRGATGKRAFATSATPKMKPMSTTAENSTSKSTLKAELAPVYVVCGLVGVAVVIASHTAFQQLVRAPSVHVNKKRRQSCPEASDPDRSINSADKFINGSFLRKVAHIQDSKPTVDDPVHPNPFTRTQSNETLKSAGVETGKR